MEAIASAVSISLPDSDALPDSSRPASTRWSFRFARSLRSLTASGANFFSKAAALRATWSTRNSGAVAARISSARAASAVVRVRVYMAIQPALGLVDHSGRHAGEGHREAGGQVDRIVDPVARVDS